MSNANDNVDEDKWVRYILVNYIIICRLIFINFWIRDIIAKQMFVVFISDALFILHKYRKSVSRRYNSQIALSHPVLLFETRSSLKQHTFLQMRIWILLQPNFIFSLEGDLFHVKQGNNYTMYFVKIVALFVAI